MWKAWKACVRVVKAVHSKKVGWSVRMTGASVNSGLTRRAIMVSGTPILGQRHRGMNRSGASRYSWEVIDNRKVGGLH